MLERLDFQTIKIINQTTTPSLPAKSHFYLIVGNDFPGDKTSHVSYMTKNRCDVSKVKMKKGDNKYVICNRNGKATNKKNNKHDRLLPCTDHCAEKAV